MWPPWRIFSASRWTENPCLSTSKSLSRRKHKPQTSLKKQQLTSALLAYSLLNWHLTSRESHPNHTIRAILGDGEICKARCRPQKKSWTKEIAETATKLAARQSEQFKAKQPVCFSYGTFAGSKAPDNPWPVHNSTHRSTSKRAHRQQLPKFLLARQAQPRPRPRERQGSWTLGQTQETLLSLDGVDSRHTTNQCPEKKKM